MLEPRVTLAGLWTSLMLVFLLGDVIRIFAGDFTAGQVAGKPAGQGTWMLIAVIMLTPILMIVMSMLLPYPAIRWVTLVMAVAWVLFNLAGLPYPGMYDNFLIVVSVVLCAAIVWYAWRW